MTDLAQSASTPKEPEWHTTACILCSINCGVEIKLEGRKMVRVRGDKSHPASKGYTCEKALRLDHYQNGSDRLSSPLRRRADGTFEEIDWDTAIAEIAQKFMAIRDEHGGESIFYYGGGGQGNHLGGVFSSATRATLGSKFSSNALAQEKTGEFWVDGQLFGAARCHTAPDIHNAEVTVFVGKNVWQSHGFPRARVAIKEIAKDPARSMIVIDPRRTETADLADFFLQVRPGGDAWLLAAMLAILVEEGLMNEAWLAEHANGVEAVVELLRAVDIGAYCERADVDEDLVRAATRRIGQAGSVSVLEDLGIQMAPHSTLNSWLEKLLYLLTGNFAKKGGVNIHSGFASLGGGGSGRRARTSPVEGRRILSGMVACNHIPDEILTDHPDRFRAMLIESANPVHSLADSARWREALQELELVVVIDVAMTETARHADYVLPAASQYEKAECTFFTLEFPENDFQLRHPILEPLDGTLPEPEIHSRLVKAMGGYTDDDLASLRAAASRGRPEFAAEFFESISAKPHLNALAAVVLYETLGQTLGPGLAPAAALWGLSHRCAAANGPSLQRAGFEGDTLEQGEALFDAIISNPQGVIFSVDPYEQTWDRMVHPDQKVSLVIDELVDEFRALASMEAATNDAFPLVLSAGERRSFTANTVIRDPQWRKKDGDGALRISLADAASLGIDEGARVRVITRTGQAETTAELSDTMRDGHVSLPNGFGIEYPDEVGEHKVHGIAPNELTSIEDRDWFAGTPFHKHVPARVELVG